MFDQYFAPWLCLAAGLLFFFAMAYLSIKASSYRTNERVLKNVIEGDDNEEAERRNYNAHMRSATFWTGNGEDYIDYDGHRRSLGGTIIEYNAAEPFEKNTRKK